VRLNHHRAGRGEPLVLIHGIGSHWQMWEPVLDGLVAHREVIALDLPGFGASPMPPAGTPAGIDSLVSLVAEFLAELGLSRPHAAGNSLGGLVALELAKRGLVSSANGLSPAGFANGPETVLARSTLWLAVRSARWLAPRVDPLAARPRGRMLLFGAFLARPAQLPARDAAEAVRALGGAPWFDDTLRTIGPSQFAGGEEIDVPVTIAWGEKDRLLLPRQAERAARAIPSARMVILRGCGHVPTYDDPEQVAQVLLEGSSSQSASPPPLRGHGQLAGTGQ
jgi:pimeloyl-ACP methyl ester carboxylesterase